MKKWYLKKIKEANGDEKKLLALNMKLATDIEIAGKNKQDVFKAIIMAKNQGRK